MKRGSLVYQLTERAKSLTAYGVSRHALKAEVRADARSPGTRSGWNPTTGRIHSYKTFQGYLDHGIRFALWARETAAVRTLGDLDRRGRELGAAYLRHRLAEGDSPWSVQTYRAALRMILGDREIGQDVVIPPRRREAIKRSRRAAKHDAEFAPARHRDLIDFVRATGLRRREATYLRVRQVSVASDGSVRLNDVVGKGGRVRSVPVLRGHEEDVLSVVRGRGEDERVFERIPRHYDEHADRRAYAQALYRQLTGREPPPGEGRLSPGSYDRAGALAVSHALGHGRVDVVLRHYLR